MESNDAFFEQTNQAGTMKGFALPKEERLSGRKAVEALFAGKVSATKAFPIRAIFTPVEEADNEPQARIMTSVSKHRFKRAVKRNRAKRQLREAYRLNKQILWDALTEKNIRLRIAFVWMANEEMDTHLVEARMREVLKKIIKRL